jgi:hypothetical protein
MSRRKPLIPFEREYVLESHVSCLSRSETVSTCWWICLFGYMLTCLLLRPRCKHVQRYIANIRIYEYTALD